MNKEHNISDFAEEYANERLDKYLKESKQELEDYKVIAESTASVGRGGRKKLNPEDQEFINEKKKYFDLFSTQQFRDYYIGNIKTIFNSVDQEVIEYLQFIRKVDKELYKIEDSVEEMVVDYANALLGTQKMDA